RRAHRGPRRHGALADRQRQPRGAGAGVRGAAPLGVPAHRRAATPATHDGLAGQPDRAVLSSARVAARGATPILDLIRTRTESFAIAVCLTRRSAARLSSFDGTSPMTRMVTGGPLQTGTRTIAVSGHASRSGSWPSASTIKPLTATASPSRLSRNALTLPASA